MSTTEELLATGTLTAAERRERRRARILASSDARLNRILSGPDGEEKRQAPAMEGGEGYRFASTAYSPHNLSNDVEMEDVMAPLTETMRKFTVAGNGDQPATTTGETEIPSLASLGINYKRPPLFALTESRRLAVVIAFGIVLFFLEASDTTSTVWIPWTIAFLTYSIFESYRDTSTYPSHGYIVNALIWAGMKERAVINIGFMAESLWAYARDTATITFVYLAASIIRNAIDHFLQ